MRVTYLRLRVGVSTPSSRGSPIAPLLPPVRTDKLMDDGNVAEAFPMPSSRGEFVCAAFWDISEMAWYRLMP
ncbi:hypothetical protein PMI03_01045 [Rhizobium sp. AP16]|nr:hypothetical protein PMI03_01045 [Rhizobium sp. AP16]